MHKLTFEKKTLLATAGAVALVLHVPWLRAQPEKPLAFEVASIKANKSIDPHSFGTIKGKPGGRLTITGAPLYMIIAAAYNVSFQSPRLSGGPDWIREARYDIEATAEKGSIPAELSPKEQDAKMRLMLQALLADRFHLTMRHESKEVPVYAVVVNKGGPKLQKSETEAKDCAEPGKEGGVPCHRFMGGQGRGLNGQAVNIADLAGFVENWSDRPVLDKTSLQGLFDIKSEGWAPLIPSGGPHGGGEENLADPSRPTLFTIFEQLGLKLEPQKAPVDIYVIEKVERPSEN